MAKPDIPQKICDINILIAGAAGQGIQTIGAMLCKTLFRGGWHLFCLQDYQSRIRGGHNTMRVRVSSQPVTASTERIDMLVALNEESIRMHLPRVVRDGIIIYDAGKVKPSEALKNCAGVPLEILAEQTVKDKKLTNTVALGAILGMLDYDLPILRDILSKKMSKKGASVIDMNIAAAQAGFEYIKEHHHRTMGVSLPADQKYQKKQEILRKSKVFKSGGRMLVNGIEAGGFGLLAAGVRFYSAYPMTPSTGLLNYAAAHAQKHHIIVEQAEDEIAAVQMALGASYAGARSAVGTSGGGFALMVESLSMAGMMEQPIVIFVMQRPGPATGLPTRTEQADLAFVIHAGHGEFPRFVFAPGDPLEMFNLTVKAFNLADTYQVPVIILGDQYLADSYRVMDMFDVSKVSVSRHLLSPEQVTAEYQRYALAENSVSPRAVPGSGKGVVVVDSDEHDENGHLTENLDMRVKQADKRMKKLEHMKKEMPPLTRFGDLKAPIRLVCWGSTLGIAQEAVDTLRSKREQIECIHLSCLWPFPGEALKEALAGASRIIAIENNSEGQLCRLIAAETGIQIKEKKLKYNGMQFFPDEIIGYING